MVRVNSQSHFLYSVGLTFSVAFCYRLKRQTVAGHPRSKCKEPMADGSWSDESEKLFVSTQPSAFSLQPRLVAPALLIAGNELILREVLWLNRSLQRFLCR